MFYGLRDNRAYLSPDGKPSITAADGTTEVSQLRCHPLGDRGEFGGRGWDMNLRYPRSPVFCEEVVVNEPAHLCPNVALPR